MRWGRVKRKGYYLGRPLLGELMKDRQCPECGKDLRKHPVPYALFEDGISVGMQIRCDLLRDTH